MGQLVDVVYDDEGNVLALGFPAPAHNADVQPESGPDPQPGQRVGQLSLPPDVGSMRQLDLSRLRVDTTGETHKLSLQ